MPPSGRRTPSLASALTAVALAACAGPSVPGPAPTPDRPAAGAFGPVPGAVQAREFEERRRGIGFPPPSPPPGVVDRLPGALRSAQPAPGLGPANPPPAASSLPVPGNSQSRLSALPASPLANPRGGFMPGRP